MITPKADLEPVKTSGSVDTSKMIESSTTTSTKGQKNMKQQQEAIQMSIENKNIENHVKELAQKFDPPLCVNCPKRRADRVCTNKECGPAKYLQIICGKCHADVHAKSSKKPEIDIEEYFIKLATFMNEQKYLVGSKQSSSIDVNHLNNVFNNLNSIREHLTSIKSKISSEIEGYQSPQQMHSLLQESITKALSQCEYENIQEQLRSIKKSVLFEKNKFLWNDAGQKFKSFIHKSYQLDDQLEATRKTLSKSFLGGLEINLGELQMIYCPGVSSLGYSNFGGKGSWGNQSNHQQNIKPVDGVFKVSSSGYNQMQYYLDYKLDRNKKYKLRIKFTRNPKNYVMIGIMPFDKVNNTWVYGVQNEYFCKRFFNQSPNMDCVKVIKGSDLGAFPKEGTQIEMRIDMEENYIDFADYPDYKNVNTNFPHQKLQSNQPYVIAIALYQDQTVIIESLEEISQIETY